MFSFLSPPSSKFFLLLLLLTSTGVSCNRIGRRLYINQRNVSMFYSPKPYEHSLRAVALKFPQNDHMHTILSLFFHYSEKIFSISRRAMTLKVAQNDHVLTLFPTRIKLAIKSQGNLRNKHMNIKTIENG